MSGVYGTLGVAAAGNVPGGRDSAISWTDRSGNLWLFSGEGYDSTLGGGALNDLWEFNPASKEWTWVSGPKLAHASGVYGTLGVAAVGNVPGGRDLAVSWIDGSGNLWLFGGYGNDSTGNPLLNTEDLNDLWEFNPASKEWTWVSGSNVREANGVYGTLGVAAAGNVPGARDSAVSWIDSSGNLWFFGGWGNDSIWNWGELNDLWEFNPGSKEWTWVSGPSSLGILGEPGVYGTIGVAAASNVPGGRANAVSWIDSGGNLWLFGGWGYDSAGYQRELNDLWEFNPGSKEWTWVSGVSSLGSSKGEPGVYGTLGVAAAGNVPGGREYAVSWTDSSGNFWLSGGEGVNSTGTYGDLNDLWNYQP